MADVKAVDLGYRTLRPQFSGGVRDAINGFIDGHDVAWELAMAALAVVYVAIGFAWDASGVSQPALDAADLALTLIFLAEFSVRIAASRNRGQYLRDHLIDLVALIPIARGVRVFRLVRLLRLIRAFTSVQRAFVSVESAANHHGLGTLVIAWFGTMLLCSWGFLIAESGSNPAVDEPGDAIWWGIMQLTGGPATIQAVTYEGQWITAILLILGVALFTAITAVLVSVIVKSDVSSGGSSDPTSGLRRLKSLHDEGLISDTDYEERKTVALDNALGS